MKIVMYASSPISLTVLATENNNSKRKDYPTICLTVTSNNSTVLMNYGFQHNEKHSTNYFPVNYHLILPR